MAKIKIYIEIPYNELCDECNYIKYKSEGTLSVCSIFSTQLETNSDDLYIPCTDCLERRG